MCSCDHFKKLEHFKYITSSVFYDYLNSVLKCTNYDIPELNKYCITENEQIQISDIYRHNYFVIKFIYDLLKQKVYLAEFWCIK